MSALVCLSGEGGRSDRAAPLSVLASGSLAASTVWSTKEREAAKEEEERDAERVSKKKKEENKTGKRRKTEKTETYRREESIKGNGEGFKCGEK